MKIFVHDFAGHPFQFQLSRELARRGHKVTHAYFADLSGPKGNFRVAPSEAGSLTVEALRLNAAFDRYSYLQRLKAHYKYVTLLKETVREHQPDVVISGNMPTDAQYLFARSCIHQNIRFVHWVQDFYALALETLLRRKLGALSRLVAAPFYMLERRIFRRSDAVVYISDDFSKYAACKGFSPRREKTIENWASLEELRPESKTNSFSRAHSLDDAFVFLYSGTMGLKHSPHTLVDLARHFRDRPEIRVVLVSEGIGRSVLEECKRKENLDNLVLLDFQPFEILPQVFGSADVLLANVEPESSVFSVPSKILSYLCAARPILLSVPTENLGARVVERAGAGFTCRPGDVSGFLNCADRMWSNRELRLKMGSNARKYAESMFNMAYVGDLFEDVLDEPTPNRAHVLKSEFRSDEYSTASVEAHPTGQDSLISPCLGATEQIRHSPDSRPTIGVLITSYNYCHFAQDCLDSVINQEPQFDEIVVVDDGSTDGSVELLRSYSKRVKVISKRNGGQLSALVAGIEEMHSDFIYTLDIDDYVTPNFVREIMAHLQSRPAKIQFQLMGVDVNKNLLGSVFPTYPEHYGAAEMIEDNRIIGFYQCPTTSGNIFRRDVLKNMRLDRMNLRDAIDGQPTLAMPYLGPVLSLNKPLTYYRAHGDGDSRWDNPDSGLLKREIDRFHQRWKDVCELLGMEHPPFGAEIPLYILERRLMQCVFESGESFPRNVSAYTRRLLTARLPVKQKLVLGVWALAFLVPLARWRQYLVMVRRSPLNRSAGLQRVISALTQIPHELTPDSGETSAAPILQERR